MDRLTDFLIFFMAAVAGLILFVFGVRETVRSNGSGKLNRFFLYLSIVLVFFGNFTRAHSGDAVKEFNEAAEPGMSLKKQASGISDSTLLEIDRIMGQIERGVAGKDLDRESRTIKFFEIIEKTNDLLDLMKQNTLFTRGYASRIYQALFKAFDLVKDVKLKERLTHADITRAEYLNRMMKLCDASFFYFRKAVPEDRYTIDPVDRTPPGRETIKKYGVFPVQPLYGVRPTPVLEYGVRPMPKPGPERFKSQQSVASSEDELYIYQAGGVWRKIEKGTLINLTSVVDNRNLSAAMIQMSGGNTLMLKSHDVVTGWELHGESADSVIDNIRP